MAADRHSAGPRKGGGPVAGIPSAGDAGKVWHGATRVLLRIAVLVGLVVCGWLLGTATGLAQEAGPGTGTVQDWGHAAAPHPAGTPAAHPGTAAHPRTPAHPGTPVARFAAHAPATPSDAPAGEAHPDGLLTPLAGAGVGAVAPPVDAVLQLPAPVPPVVLKAVQPLAAPVLDTVGRSVADPVVARVLGQTSPQPAERPAADPVRAADDRAAPFPAEPAPTGAGPPPAAALPAAPVHAPALPALGAPSGTTAYPAERLAGSSGAEQPAPPVPANLPGATGASCPPGSTGTNSAAQATYAAILDDGLATAESALVQRRLRADEGALPRCAGQRPSTSPD